jgi:hypothetical protein
VFLPFNFPDQNFYAFIIAPMRATCPTHLIVKVIHFKSIAIQRFRTLQRRTLFLLPPQKFERCLVYVVDDRKLRRGWNGEVFS